MEIDDRVFITRMYYNQNIDNLTILRGKIPEKYKKIKNKKCQVLIRFLEKNNHKMVSHIIKNQNIDNEFMKEIKDFYDNNILLVNNFYNDEKHILISQLFVLQNYNKLKNSQNIVIKPNKELIDFEKELNNIKNIKNYKVLKEKRLFNIYDELYCFQLERNKMDYEIMKKEILLHWEYYAFHCPLWRNRFINYGGKLDKSKEIYFSNDDKLEEFYDMYGFELDEQSKEVQNKSLKYIKNKNNCSFSDNIYGFAFPFHY
jgi:hypothetical protein